MTADRSTDRKTHERAMDEARKTPLLFIPRHIRNVEIQRQVHGTTAIGGFNAAVAVLVTKVVGTMYCAYAFTLIALVALPAALAQGSPTVLVNWLSSNFLQLVLLPIILVGQSVISKAQGNPISSWITGRKSVSAGSDVCRVNSVRQPCAIRVEALASTKL